MELNHQLRPAFNYHTRTVFFLYLSWIFTQARQYHCRKLYIIRVNVA